VYLHRRRDAVKKILYNSRILPFCTRLYSSTYDKQYHD